MDFEKSAMKSKKFIAFLLVEIGLFALMGLMVYSGGYEDSFNFLTVIVTTGFLASFFIGGQALVDKYTRVALITSRSQLGDKTTSSEDGNASSEEENQDSGEEIQ